MMPGGLLFLRRKGLECGTSAFPRAPGPVVRAPRCSQSIWSRPSRSPRRLPRLRVSPIDRSARRRIALTPSSQTATLIILPSRDVVAAAPPYYSEPRRRRQPARAVPREVYELAAASERPASSDAGQGVPGRHGPRRPRPADAQGVPPRQTADVVLYDRLVSPAILDLVHDGAHMLYVGKQAGFHTRTQDEIEHMPPRVRARRAPRWCA